MITPSVFPFSVILPLVGAVLGALIGGWVDEGIAPPVIGAAWGGLVGSRAAGADSVLANSRLIFLRMGLRDPWGNRMEPQALGALLIGWLADVDAFICIGVLLGLGALATMALFAFGLAMIPIVSFASKRLRTPRQRKIFDIAGGVAVSMPVSAYIYWLFLPALCLTTGLWFAHQSGGNYDWAYRLLAAWLCPYLVACWSKREYRLAESDDERKRQIPIFRFGTMGLMALFALYAYFPEIPAFLFPGNSGIPLFWRVSI